MDPGGGPGPLGSKKKKKNKYIYIYFSYYIFYLVVGPLTKTLSTLSPQSA